jgi:hypothetical protein
VEAGSVSEMLPAQKLSIPDQYLKQFVPFMLTVCKKILTSVIIKNIADQTLSFYSKQ